MIKSRDGLGAGLSIYNNVRMRVRTLLYIDRNFPIAYILAGRDASMRLYIFPRMMELNG